MTTPESTIQGVLDRCNSPLFKVKRYCKLIGNQFFLFKSPAFRELDEVILLTSDYKIEMVDSHRFSISPPAGDSLTLQASSPDSMATWVFHLRSCAFTNPKMSIGMFDFITLLGKGHFGTVCLYVHRETGDLTAIKAISKARMVENHKVKCVLAERNILKKARHPFIVGLKFAFQTPTTFYLGLEYVRGRDLFVHINDSLSLPLPHVRFYVAEIACALHYLHSLGVIYRDLKPENILLDADGHVKLTDFGLSREVGHDLTATSFCGTLEYLAPEVLLKEPYSFEMDWWSLGVLTFEMLFGKTPFGGSTSGSRTLQKILNGRVAFPVEADPAVVAFCGMLLERDRQKRGDFEAIKRAVVFQGMDWDAVERKGIAPPFVPGECTVPVADGNRVAPPEISEGYAIDPELAPRIPGFSYTDPQVDVDETPESALVEHGDDYDYV
jgi:serine/threonine protein kinase